MPAAARIPPLRVAPIVPAATLPTCTWMSAVTVPRPSAFVFRWKATLRSGCSTKSFHFFFFFFNLIFFQITGIKLFVFSFVNKFITVWKILQVFINFLIDKWSRPSFSFHGTEKFIQVMNLKIYVAPIALERMVFWKWIYELFKELYFFKFGNGIKRCFFKQV